MPSVAFVFAEIMALFFNFDTDYMRDRSETLALAMFGVSIAAIIASGVQGGIFGIVGERLTTRFALARISRDDASGHPIL